MGGSPRSATVLAIGDVQVGVLDSQRLATEYATVPEEFRGLVLSLDKRLKQATARAITAYLKQNAAEEQREEQVTIIKQGDDDERLFKIFQGTASIVRKTDHGDVLLANLGEGDFIGRVPFLNIGHEPHGASVVASEDLEYHELDPNDLQKAYNKLSGTLRNIIEHVAICVSVTTKVACDFHGEIGTRK
jgi:CRP-like cAMP-binding protein